MYLYNGKLCFRNALAAQKKRSEQLKHIAEGSLMEYIDNTAHVNKHIFESVELALSNGAEETLLEYMTDDLKMCVSPKCISTIVRNNDIKTMKLLVKIKPSLERMQPSQFFIDCFTMVIQNDNLAMLTLLTSLRDDQFQLKKIY